MKKKKSRKKFLKEYPEFNYNTNIFDKKLDCIPCFNEIYRYIVEHNLINVIVELAVYDRPIGINHEKIVVFEIRTEF